MDKSEIVAQLAARQELITNPAVIEAATALYIDSKSEQPKKGSGGQATGSPRRLADVLNQFDITWDLYAMNSEKILEMLPKEFDRFKSDSA